jgi:cytochrome c peroxidase
VQAGLQPIKDRIQKKQPQNLTNHTKKNKLAKSAIIKKEGMVHARQLFIGIAMLSCILLCFAGTQQAATPLTPAQQFAQLQQLGKLIFFDQKLSVNGTQSRASCHAPGVGYTGPDSLINAVGVIYPGALEDRFGNRKPPASSYAGESPELSFDKTSGNWAGGMFWDGRAAGWILGDPLAEQAGGPFLNPLEQGMPGARQVCLRVAHSDYADLFEEVWGSKLLDCVNDVRGSYE